MQSREVEERNRGSNASPPDPPGMRARTDQDGRTWALVEHGDKRELLRWSGKTWQQVDTAERVPGRMDPVRAWAWEFSSDRRFQRARARLHRVMQGKAKGIVIASALSDVTVW